jgi:X-X-X-Leu-X-X-Gly heptad repeat protein
MATQKSKNGSSAKAGATKAKSGAKQVKSGAKQVAKAEKNQARVVAETAVDIPVGVVLSVTDRVTDLVEPFTGRDTAERKLKAYRSEVRRTLKRTERRGTTARRKATTEAKRTRTRVEREARKRQRTVETTLKKNRSEVEQRVRKAIDEQTSRAQDIVDQVADQIASLR